MQETPAKLIVICGPTTSGKTELSLKLAKKYNGEIICADSRTIYQQMDIGTAKPLQNRKTEKQKDRKTEKPFGTNDVAALFVPIIIDGISHYMIDIIKPDQGFTVAKFKQKTLKIIKNIHQRKKIPFLVGGTGLYISAIVDNLDIPRVPPDKKLRKKLEKNIQKQGLNYLWEKLIKLDPGAADFVQEQNPRRIIRAMEVCLKTKKPFSKLRKKGQNLFNVLQIGIKLPREKLYQKINQRVDKMIKMGLVKETENLTKKYPPSLPSLNTISYQEIVSYLQGEITLEQAIDLIKKNTRHYARRQMTWFKKNKKIKWVKNYRQTKKQIEKFLEEH